MLNILTAQASELSSVCIDSPTETAATEHQGDNHPDNEDSTSHCHHSCVQCHTFYVESPLTTFTISLTQQLLIFTDHTLPSLQIETTFDRPPIS